jgi:hypothetical protein
MERPNQKKKISSRPIKVGTPLARAPRRLVARDLQNSMISRMISARRARRIATSLTLGSVIILGKSIFCVFCGIILYKDKSLDISLLGKSRYKEFVFS